MNPLLSSVSGSATNPAKPASLLNCEEFVNADRHFFVCLPSHPSCTFFFSRRINFRCTVHSPSSLQVMQKRKRSGSADLYASAPLGILTKDIIDCSRVFLKIDQLVIPEMDILRDVDLVVEDEVFKCHKIILIAHSGYFKAMLTNGMRETKLRVIELKEFSNNTWRNVMKYLFVRRPTGYALLSIALRRQKIKYKGNYKLTITASAIIYLGPSCNTRCYLSW